jgi:hypothetical protein
VPAEIGDEDKRLALARVLQSRTFGRSDQLRAFLRYVCEAELEGRAQQLNEYALGVSVLGRREGYSPAEDSSVRSRAYELRQKLKSYYTDEAPDDPIRIEIEKGAYVPRYQARAGAPPGDRPSDAQPAPAAVTGRAPPDASPAAGRTRVGTRVRVVALAAAGLAVVALILFWQARATPGAGGLAAGASTREMRALWKPFLDGRTPLLISFEVRLFLYAPPTGLVVRDYRANQMAEVAQSEALQAFRQKMGAEDLVETHDYADVGAVQAAFLLGRLLDREVGLKHANALGWEDVWNSNVIFVGKSTANPIIRRVLRDADLDFTDSEHGTAVLNRRPAPGESARYENAATHGAGKKYGVISVLPGPQPGHAIMLLTGGGAELMWALAQSVSDPVRVAEIMTRVIPASGQLPGAFQVVIEATFESNVPINIRYVTHHVYGAK